MKLVAHRNQQKGTRVRAQDAYEDVPYHNAVHGCDVMHACYWMLPTGRGHDTALFRRLVLGWIEADFRVQIRTF